MLTKNFSPFPALQTERLLLRKISIEDAEAIFTLRSDERVNEFIDRPRAHSVDDARNFINQIRSRGSNSELLYWAITQRRDAKLIGTIMFWNLSDDNKSAEIGFELLPYYQGQGLMREALSTVVNFGFEQMQFTTIEAIAEEENERSIVLLEKAGFKKDPDYVHSPGQDSSDQKTVLRYTINSF